MPPEVTAVITTHARPASVCEALRSVQAELHGDVEVVIVDDGGTFAAPLDLGIPIRTVHGSGLGVARARNLGLNAARGEFVICLDDDDVALPHRVSTLLAATRQHEATLCFGWTRRVFDDAANVLPPVPTNLASAGRVGFGDLLTCAPHVNAVLVRTDALRAAGGFDEAADHFDDWAAWLRLADRGAVIWSVAETVAEWRIHSRGLSGQLLHVGAMNDGSCRCSSTSRAASPTPTHERSPRRGASSRPARSQPTMTMSMRWSPRERACAGTRHRRPYGRAVFVRDSFEGGCPRRRRERSDRHRDACRSA